MLRRMINLLRYLMVSLFYKLKFGKRVLVGVTTYMIATPKITVSKGGEVCISAHCRVEKCELVAVSGGKIQIGEYTSIGGNDLFVSRGKVVIGTHCSIAPNVSIYDHNHIFGASGLRDGYTIKDIKIGNNVWIGVGTIILAGTTIGDNCVIGAGTIVHGNIPDNSLVTNSREMKIKKLIDISETSKI